MSMYWISASLGYHEGDPLPDSVPVPQRPGPTHVWDGQAWQTGPAPVPAEVSIVQARIALRRAGLLAAVETAIEARGGELWDRWHYGRTIARSDPDLGPMAAHLGLNADQIDDLFRAAGAIT